MSANSIGCRAALALSLFALLAGQASAKTPTISGLSPNSGVVGTSITISGSNFGSSQGSSTVTFNGVTAAPTSWKTGSIAVPVPAAATTGPVVVKVGGVASNGVTFTVTPVVSSLSPTAGPVGTSVTIAGSGFGASQGTNTVSFNGVSAAPTSWGDTSITAPVPSGASTGPVTATINGVTSNGISFTVPPVLESITVTPPTSSLAAGVKSQLTATGTYSDNSTQNLTFVATWSSLNGSVAAANGFGIVTAQNAGTTTITATYGSVNGSATLTVTPPSLVSIQISPSNPYVPQGDTQQLVATGHYSDGSTQDLTSSVAWTTSDSTIATVSADGLITAVATGSAVVTAAGNALTFSTGITVTTGQPTITATALPAPNAAGWNNSSVTVTFTCIPGSYPIASCPAPQLVSTEGQNQVVSGTLTDTNGQWASSSVTLNIDMTPPTLTVSDPTDQQVFSNSSITSSGTLSDSLSGLSSLSCDGASETPTANYSCNITLNPGLNAVVVQASDVAGNIALIKLHVDLNAYSVPASIQITPATPSVAVGSTQQFTAVDNSGAVRPDATWTISNQSIATITPDSSPWLTGVAVGTATLTATVQGVSAQTQVTVLSGGLPSGAPLWTAPLLSSSFTPRDLVSGNPLPITGVPDFYDLETDNNWATPYYRGFTIDGQQLWQHVIGPQSSRYPAAVADASGGLLVQVWGSGGNTPLLMDLDAQTGATVWQTSFASDATLPLNNEGGFRNFSIRPDNTVVIHGSVPSLPSYDPNNQVALFNAAGARAPVPIQTEEYTVTGGACMPLPSGVPSAGLYAAADMATDETGNTYFEYTHVDKWAVTCTSNPNPNADVSAWTSSLRLVTIGAGGSTSDQVITSSMESASFGAGADTIEDPIAAGAVAPDGQGGILLTWAQRPPWTGATVPLEVTHISPNGTVAYELPVPVPMNAQYEGAVHDQLVLGDNETGFVLNGQTLVSFNVNSGAVNWSYESPVALSLLASSAGGGIAAQEVSAADTVLRFDASGNVTVDSWSASGVNNFGGSLWLGYTNNGAAGYSAAPVELSGASWYAPDGNGGNAAKQDVTVTGFSQTGTNQTVTTGSAQEILDALPLTTFTGAPACFAWIQGGPDGANSLSDLQGLLNQNPSGLGHGVVKFGGQISYYNWAVSGVAGENPDGTATGVPGGVETVVNDDGGFFNSNYPNIAPYDGAPIVIGPRNYAGATLRGQALVMLHEFGHALILPAPFQQNDAGHEGTVKINNAQVDKNCRPMIEALPSVTSISPASGSVGTSVTISGLNLGASQGSSTVAFNGTLATPTSWTANGQGVTTIVVPVPSGATGGNIIVKVSGVRTTWPAFTVQ